MGRHMKIVHETLHRPPHNEEVGALPITGKQRSCPFTSTDPKASRFPAELRAEMPEVTEGKNRRGNAHCM